MVLSRFLKSTDVRPGVIGVAWSLGSLVLMWPLALSVAECFRHHFLRGATTLAVAVGARLLLNVIVESALARDGRLQREAARRQLGTVARRLAQNDRGFSAIVPASESVSLRGSIAALQWATATSVIGLPIVFHYGGYLALLIVVGLAGISVPWYIRAGRAAAADDQHFRHLRESLTTSQRELLRHATELRSLGALPYGERRIEALSSREHEATASAIRRALGSSLVTDFLGGVSVGLVAMVVGFNLLHGHGSVEGAVLSVLATAEMIGWVRSFGSAFHQREAVEEARVLLETPPIESIPSVALIECHHLVTRANAQPVTEILHPGERVGVIGPSGSGKSTLLATWLGWQQPREGTVRRSTAPISYVSPRSALVGATLRDNLTLGRGLSDETLRGLLRELNLTLSLNEVITVDGRGMSTGERVRIIIARGILSGAPLLVLDDVAGLLDEANQRCVQETLRRRSHLAIVEAAVDQPQLISADRLVVLS